MRHPASRMHLLMDMKPMTSIAGIVTGTAGDI